MQNKTRKIALAFRKYWNAGYLERLWGFAGQAATLIFNASLRLKKKLKIETESLAWR